MIWMENTKRAVLFNISFPKQISSFDSEISLTEDKSVKTSFSQRVMRDLGGLSYFK